MIQPVIFKSKVVLVEKSSYRAPSLEPLILGSSKCSHGVVNHMTALFYRKVLIESLKIEKS